MEILQRKLYSFALMFLLGTFLITSCKTKKAVVNAQEPVAEVVNEEKAEEPVQEETKVEEAPVKEEMPDFNYTNVLFEVNSSVLKTSSYEVLEKIGREMKKYPSVRFNVEGHASIEGTEEHNLTLSVDRANSVKSYLVNMGVESDNLVTKGFGASKPVASNDTESGRVLNRRVEIKRM